MPEIEPVRVTPFSMRPVDGEITARLEGGPGDGLEVQLPAARGMGAANVHLRIDGSVHAYFSSPPLTRGWRDGEPHRYCYGWLVEEEQG